MQHVSSSVFIAACGILFSDSGSDPGPPALEVWSLSHWTTTKSSEHGSDSTVSLTRLTLNGRALKATHREGFLASLSFSCPEKPLYSYTLWSSGICEHFFLFLDCTSHPTATSVPTLSPAFQSPTDSSRLHRSHHLCEAFLNFSCRIITHILLQALFYPL